MVFKFKMVGTYFCQISWSNVFVKRIFLLNVRRLCEKNVFVKCWVPDDFSDPHTLILEQAPIQSMSEIFPLKCSEDSLLPLCAEVFFKTNMYSMLIDLINLGRLQGY